MYYRSLVSPANKDVACVDMRCGPRVQSAQLGKGLLDQLKKAFASLIDPGCHTGPPSHFAGNPKTIPTLVSDERASSGAHQFAILKRSQLPLITSPNHDCR